LRASINQGLHALPDDRLGSASELRYLLGLAARLGFLPGRDVSTLEKKCGELLRTMQRLIDALERRP